MEYDFLGLFYKVKKFLDKIKNIKGLVYLKLMNNYFAKYSLFCLVFLFIFTLGIAADDGNSNEIFIPDVSYSFEKLNNGLQVYVFEDHKVPMVKVSIWYKVGSINEEEGITGISHLLEHTMFLGTKTLKKGQVHKLVKKVGGHNNAGTGYSSTRYYERVPANSMELAFAIEADRMHNLLIDPEEFSREKEVVMQERRMRIENSVFDSAYEEIRAEAFKKSPLHHSVAGWMEDIKNLTPEKVRDYYHKYYAPNNAVLVVSGDAKPAEVFKLARKHFGDYKAVEIVRNISKEPKQREEKVITVEKITRVPYIVMLYKTPVGDHQDIMPIKFLLDILVNKANSKVNLELKMKQEILLAAGAGVEEMPIPAYTRVILVPGSVDKIQAVQKGFEKELKKLIENGIDAEEIQIIKKSILKDLVFRQRDILSFAGSVVAGEVKYGDTDLYKKNYQQIKDITEKDIIRVAKKYFRKENRTVGYIVPKKTEEGEVK